MYESKKLGKNRVSILNKNYKNETIKDYSKNETKLSLILYYLLYYPIEPIL